VPVAYDIAAELLTIILLIYNNKLHGTPLLAHGHDFINTADLVKDFQ